MDLATSLLQHLPPSSLESLQASIAAAVAATSVASSITPTTTTSSSPVASSSSPPLLAPTPSITLASSSTTPSLVSSEGTSSSSPIKEIGNAERPSLSYKDLIIEAIESSPEKRLKLNEIYQVIRLLHPYYRMRPDQWGWQNSIRHNLSLHDCFVKLPLKQTNASGVVGHYWTVVPELSDKQTLRRRNRNGGRSSAPRGGNRAAAIAATRSEESPVGSPHSSTSVSPSNEMMLPKPTAMYGGIGMLGGGGINVADSVISPMLNSFTHEQVNLYAQQLLTQLMYQQVSGLLQMQPASLAGADSSSAFNTSLLEPLLTLSKLATAGGSPQQSSNGSLCKNESMLM